MEGNTKTVFVVQVDNSKDLSDAKKYGQLRAVFGKPRKPYNTRSMMYKARQVLANWEPGDHLLMVGDPTLGAICVAIITEQESVVNILSWDRDSFQYIPQRWDFEPQEPEFDEFTMADD